MKYLSVLMFIIFTTSLFAQNEGLVKIVSAEGLCAIYNENEAVADGAYKSKTIAVTGIVQLTGSNAGGSYIIIGEGKRPGEGVTCYMVNPESLYRAKVGDPIRIVGVVFGKMAHVVLQNCSIK